MTIDPRVDIGHVHLKVADLERSIAFYCGVLGFELAAYPRRALVEGCPLSVAPGGGGGAVAPDEAV